MRRPPFPLLRIALAALVTLAARPAGARVSAWARTAPLFVTADSLLSSGAWDGAAARLDSLAAAARARSDRGMELAALIRTSRCQTESHRPEQAVALLEPLVPEIGAARDTMLLCRALRALGRANDGRRRWADGLANYQRAARLAVRAHLPSEEGGARIGIAAHAIEEGHAAAAADEYRRALRLLRQPDDRRLRVAAHAGIARSLQSLGDVDGARREHAIVLPEAIALGDRNLVANTEFNLGSLEQMSGDMALAPAHYERSLATAIQIGRRDLVLRVAQALAVLYLQAGQHAQADSVLSRVLPEAERSTDLVSRAMLLSQFGVLRREQDRLAEGIDYGRRAVALSDSLPLTTALLITTPLARSLRDAGRYDESVALFRSQRERLGSRLDPDARSFLNEGEAISLLALRRPREGIALLRPAIAAGDSSSLARGGYFGALVTNARCWAAVGERDSALAAYARTAAYWERMRDAQSDPDWRERMDNAAAEFVAAYGIALLDPERGGSADARIREAFETLQHFRARTLAERLRAPGHAVATGPTATTLAEFQTRGLRPGELFLDLHAGVDTTLMFAVTSHGIQAWTLPAKAALSGRLRRLRSLVSDPAAETSELTAQAAAALGADLLGPAAAEIASAQRVLIAAGSFAQFPIGSVKVPGPGRHEPLAVERELAFVPSAAMLLGERAAGQPAPGSRRALLAVAFARDDAGHAIPEASKEAHWLAARFAGTDARVDEWGTSVKVLTASFAHYDGLHFATHMRENASRPWQSAMLLGGSSGHATWITAADVAGLRVPVKLCVLAGCSSVGGQGYARETLQGLATAWLAAGAQTVVATLWDADDEATRSLVHVFYEELARGKPVGQALQAAQIATRATPRWSAPYFWAGVVVLGDPGTHLALKPRPATLPSPHFH